MPDPITGAINDISGAVGSAVGGFLSPITSALGPIGAGLGALLGGERANAASAAMAREQMQFQERMSSTAYQRAVKDMRLAGINPALAFMQGGASSPSGAMAMQQDTIGPAVSSAMSAMKLRQDLQVAKGQLANMAADTTKKLADAAVSQSEVPNAPVQRVLMQAQASSARAAAANSWAILPQSELKGTMGQEGVDSVKRGKKLADWILHGGLLQYPIRAVQRRLTGGGQ